MLLPRGESYLKEGKSICTEYGSKEEYDEEYYERRYLHILKHRYDLEYLDYLGTIRFADVKLHENVLEVGCGLGTLSWGIAGESSYTVGIDFSRHAIYKARDLYSSTQKNLSFLVASSTHLPFKDESHNCIICSHLFEHMTKRDANKTQREIFRVLTKGGRIVVEQPQRSEGTLPLSIGNVLTSILDKIGLKKQKKVKKTKYRKYPTEEDWTHKQVYTFLKIFQELKGNNFSFFDFSWKFHRGMLLSIVFLLMCLLPKKRKMRVYAVAYLRSPSSIQKTCFYPLETPKIKAFKPIRKCR